MQKLESESKESKEVTNSLAGFGGLMTGAELDIMEEHEAEDAS